MCGHYTCYICLSLRVTVLLHARFDGISIKLQDVGNLIVLVVLFVSDIAGYAGYSSATPEYYQWNDSRLLIQQEVVQHRGLSGRFQIAADLFRSGAQQWNSGGRGENRRFRPLDEDAPAFAGEQAKDFRPLEDETDRYGIVYPGPGAGDSRIHRQFRPLEKRQKSYEESELDAGAGRRLPPPISPYPLTPPRWITR